MDRANKTSIKILILLHMFGFKSLLYQKSFSFCKNKMKDKDKCIYRKLNSQSIFYTVHCAPIWLREVRVYIEMTPYLRWECSDQPDY